MIKCIIKKRLRKASPNLAFLFGKENNMEFSFNAISLVDIVILILIGLFLLVEHREQKEREADIEALKADTEALRASMNALKAEQNAMKDEFGVH